MKTVDVLIPVYKPPGSFGALMESLLSQSHPAERILIMQTVYEGMQEIEWPASDRIRVYPVSRESFDHGGTRHEGMLHAEADYVLLLTQDVIIEGNDLIGRLLDAFSDDGVCVAYGRQKPAADCRLTEALSREFNYPAESCVKSADDLSRLGIKTFFCSDVCAMYDRKKYLASGGFCRHTIFNEDMIYAAGVIFGGGKIAYQADAEVIHSHNYTGMQQLRRNFDMAVSQADHPEVFQAVSSEKEGISMVKRSASKLFKAGKFYLLPGLVWQSGMKYIGYFLGKHYRKLPEKTVLRLTSNPYYWRNNNGTDSCNTL